MHGAGRGGPPNRGHYGPYGKASSGPGDATCGYQSAWARFQEERTAGRTADSARAHLERVQQSSSQQPEMTVSSVMSSNHSNWQRPYSFTREELQEIHASTLERMTCLDNQPDRFAGSTLGN